MASLLDVDDGAVVDDGTVVVVFACCYGEGEEAVELCYGVGVLLKHGYELACPLDELGVELVFEGGYLFFCSEDFLLILFEFLCDVSLGLGECLLAYPFGWYEVLVGVAHFHVVAEDVVEADLEALYACGLCFSLLYLEEVVFA